MSPHTEKCLKCVALHDLESVECTLVGVTPRRDRLRYQWNQQYTVETEQTLSRYAASSESLERGNHSIAFRAVAFNIGQPIQREVSRDAERLCLTHQLSLGVAHYEWTGSDVASGKLEKDCTSFIRIDSLVSRVLFELSAQVWIPELENTAHGVSREASDDRNQRNNFPDRTTHRSPRPPVSAP